jgi:hypothetical protein
MLARLVELSVSWIIGGAIFAGYARWAERQPNRRSVWIDSLWKWTTSGFFLIFGCTVLLDLPEPLFWAGLVWIAPFLIASVGLTLLVPVVLVLILLDAFVFARWSHSRARMTFAFQGMLFSWLEDRPKSKRKRKPKIKRKNDWGL